MESTTELPSHLKVLDLSPEIFSLIFINLDDNPTSFSRVCKSWRATAQEEYNLAQYILTRFGRREAIYYAILHLGPRCTNTFLEHLVRSGAHTSLYLLRMLVLRHAPDSPGMTFFHRYLSPSWGTTSPVDALATLAKLTEKQLKLGRPIEAEFQEDNGSEAFRLWENLLLQINEICVNVQVQMPVADMDTAKDLLEDLWRRLEEAVVQQGWVPFCPLDPLIRDCRLERAVCLEPRLLPLLNANGWDYDDEANDRFVRSLLLSQNPSANRPDNPGDPIHAAVINGVVTRTDRCTILAKDIDLFTRRFSRFHLSARVCGEGTTEWILNGQNRGGTVFDAIHVFAEQEKAGRLGFNCRDLVLDATHLLHGTRTSVLRACNNYAAIANLSCLVPQARFAYMLGKTKEDGPYQDWSHRDSPISGSLRCSSWMGRVEGPAPAWAKDEEAALDQIVDLICNPFLLSAEFILREEALHAKPHRDLPEAARRAAVRIVRMPSKGATLLSLVTQHPFLVSHIRTEILRHRISLDLLSSDSAADPFRPLYTSHRLSFLSPLGFDYENALERFIIPLGPHPWVEGCYAADPPPSSSESPFAESVWPLDPKHYFVGEGDRRKDVGFVTGKTLSEAQQDPSDEMAAWTKERDVKESLPVAIALLDMFDKNDEALDIVLGHAILNLNPSVVCAYLKEGVLLRPHHLDALDKLKLPRLEAINLHLAEQEAKASTATVVEPEKTPDKPRRRRGGARARRACEKAATVIAGAA